MKGARRDKLRASAAVDVLSWRRGDAVQTRHDSVAMEEPVEIRVRGRSVAVTMRTPGHDDELAAGFLLTEGVISARKDVIQIAPCQQGSTRENILNVFLSPKLAVDFDRLTRHVFAASSCGLCGKASIETVHQQFPPVESDVRISAEVLLKLPDRLRARQQMFSLTGGLHAAAIFDQRGRVLVSREDVGRHNAVDKVIGFGFLNARLPFDRHVLLVSGRASFEIMQKALAARIPIVCAVSAPSSLAVEFARESGQTLVGFLRETSFNIYSNPVRILEDATGNKGR
jgi:FdhD protein